MQMLQSGDHLMNMPSLKEKQIAVEDLLDQLAQRQRLDCDEQSMIRDLVAEQSAIIEVLRNENSQMKDRLPKLEPLHDEVMTYKQEASRTITSLNVKLNEMQLKISDLEDKLTKLGFDIVKIETSKNKEIEELNQRWQDKIKCADSKSKRIVDDIVKKHCEVKKGYEGVIYGLKEQVAHKEAEIAWCQLMMKERDNTIDKEIASLKKELNVTTQKNQELLEQRVIEVEKRANKITRKCLKLQHDYEQKITTLKKEKELQIQALQRQAQHIAERDTTEQDHRIEDAVKELELRYRKIIINLHTAAQQQRQQDMRRIATLESIVTPSTVSTDQYRR